MEGNTIKLEIITPDAQLYSGDIRFLVAKATDGEIGILPKHAPLMASLAIAPMRIDDAEGKSHFVAVFGGFMEVTPEKITIATPNCELPESIDLDRAQRARERAEERLREKAANIDYTRAELALKRALTRIKVATTIR